MDRVELLRLARLVARNAYAPHSGFRVGAALFADGRVFTACNVENASFGLTSCAERNAVFQAVAGGAKRFEAIAVACIDALDVSDPSTRMPCGACRQVISEFAHSDTVVHVDGVGTFSLKELLPLPFTLRTLPHSSEAPAEPDA